MPLHRRALLTTFVGILANYKVLQPQELVSALVGPGGARLEPGPVGEHRVYFQGSTEGLNSLIVGSLLLKPGQQPHPPHTHADEEVIVLAEGTGEINLNGKSSGVGPGEVMYAAPNCLHGIRNTGSTPLTLYYFKWIAKRSFA
jgi:mannose-6-phosphate isomerase-like protein (cupin superfamily)